MIFEAILLAGLFYSVFYFFHNTLFPIHEINVKELLVQYGINSLVSQNSDDKILKKDEKTSDEPSYRPSSVVISSESSSGDSSFDL